MYSFLEGITAVARKLPVLLLTLMLVLPLRVSALPSAACLAMAQTDNIIRCLSASELFQETLATGDICAQARIVYTCYNQMCCFENRAYDLERDPSLAACNIDCVRTTPPPGTTSSPPPTSDAAYVTTMAPFASPTPVAGDAEPTQWPRPHPSMLGPPLQSLPDPLPAAVSSDTITSWVTTALHPHALIAALFLPVSTVALVPLWHSFQHIRTPANQPSHRFSGSLLPWHRRRMAIY